MPNRAPAKKRKPGRPKVNPLPRAEQLRVAKRAQRRRDRAAGLTLCQVKLPGNTAGLLRAAMAIPGFDAELEKFLGDAVIAVQDFPNLQLLCWNRADPFITDRDAFGLYERNWRFVDTKNMPDLERNLIRRLADKYGHGVVNV